MHTFETNEWWRWASAHARGRALFFGCDEKTPYQTNVAASELMQLVHYVASVDTNLFDGIFIEELQNIAEEKQSANTNERKERKKRSPKCTSACMW